MGDSTERSAEEAIAAIERLTRELLSRREGAHLIEHELDRLVLDIELSLRDGSRHDKAVELRRQIDELLDDAVQHAAVFRPGQAYCHRCTSAECGHSAPPSSRHVFVGYAPTGAPKWVDFAQRCLDLRHPEVDRLYDEPPALLALSHTAEELHGGLLQSFDNGKFALLGQVTAGFFSIPGPAHEGRGVVALSIQAALSRTRRGRPRVGLNLLGRGPGGAGLDLIWERQDDLPWRRSVRWAQTALGTLGPTLGRSSRNGVDLERRVGGILAGLRRRLERGNRARSRRTRHAQERHQSGRRPTRKAIEDARDAPDEAFMHDTQSGVMVVLGDRGRTHFFASAGKLVSSVRYSPGAIAKKVKLERWQPATAEQRETLRRTLGRTDPDT
jgi:hypothetical protein